MIDFRENLVRNVERKLFTFDPVTRLELKRLPIQVGKYKGGRSYVVPCPGAVNQDPNDPDYVVFYPSVTTVISEKSDKTWLDAWKERVGYERAEQILISAQHRGTAIHQMAESYLRGQDYWKGNGTINVVDFNRVVPILNAHVSSIYGIELPLYSHNLRTAGTADLVCKWDDTNSVCDFKTARKEKLREQIESYFIQATAYALMFQERYGLTIPQIVVILLVDHEDEPRVFVEKTHDWVAKTEEMFSDENDLHR